MIENMKTTILTFLIGGLFLVAGCCTSGPSSGRATDLVILKAIYGVGSTNTVDVTAEIGMLAKSGSIHLHPQWALGVDPAYGATKRITVAYRYKGRVEVATFDQFEELVLPVDR